MCAAPRLEAVDTPSPKLSTECSTAIKVSDQIVPHVVRCPESVGCQAFQQAFLDLGESSFASLFDEMYNVYGGDFGICAMGTTKEECAAYCSKECEVALPGGIV